MFADRLLVEDIEAEDIEDIDGEEDGVKMEWTTTVNKFVLLFQTIEKECAEQYLGLKCAK